MDYKQWMHIIVFFFWITTILSCLLAVLRGRVFAISSFYLQLFVNLIVSMALVEIIIMYINDEGNISIPIFLLFIFTMSILFGVSALKSQYLFWGVGANAFLEVVHNVLSTNNLEYREEEKKGIILKNSPAEIYRCIPFIVNPAGTILNITSTKKGEIDQGKLIPKIKDALSGIAMSLSGRIILILIILFSCFMLYLYFLLMM